jgi:predicted secreted protein
MGDDRRSMRMVAAINCVLNHNARAPGAAKYPGVNHDVVDVLRKHGVGVIQMPCPEMVCLGLPRARAPGVSIRDIMDTPEGRSCCRKLSVSVVDGIEEYLRNGYTVAAVLGGDVGSPGCAVPFPPPESGAQVPASGLGTFTKALLDELRKRDIRIPIRGIRDSARETLLEDVEWLDDVLAGSG